MFNNCDNFTCDLSALPAPLIAINNYYITGMFGNIKSKLPKWYEERYKYT